MTERTCSIDGCERPHYGKGWCQRHYNRVRKGGTTELRRKAKGPHPCRIDGCTGTTGVPGTARDLCSRHYGRWQRWGDPLFVPEPLNKGKACSVEGCGRPCKSGGLCSAHDTRVRRHGSLQHPEAWGRAPEGTKWCPQCEVYKPVGEFSPHRTTKSGLSAWCKRCVADRQAKWRREHPEENARRVRERNRKQYQEHPEYYAAAAQRRRALKRGAVTERFTTAEIAERDGWRCGICGKRIGRTIKWPSPQSLSLDHIVPLSRGGDHVRANVQAAHLVCNQRKFVSGSGQLRLLG